MGVIIYKVKILLLGQLNDCRCNYLIPLSDTSDRILSNEKKNQLFCLPECQAIPSDNPLPLKTIKVPSQVVLSPIACSAFSETVRKMWSSGLLDRILMACPKMSGSKLND